MGDYWYLYVLPIIGGIIWWLLSSALVRVPGNLPRRILQNSQRIQMVCLQEKRWTK